jgi:hypothetical protein
MNILSRVLKSKSISFEPKDQWVRCLAHVINLAVQAALTSLKATAVNSEDAVLWELEEETNAESVSVISKVS